MHTNITIVVSSASALAQSVWVHDMTYVFRLASHGSHLNGQINDNSSALEGRNISALVNRCVRLCVFGPDQIGMCRAGGVSDDFGKGHTNAARHVNLVGHTDGSRHHG